MRHFQKKSLTEESNQALPSNDIGHLVALAVDLTAPLHEVGGHQPMPSSMIGNPYVVASARGPAPVPRRVSSSTTDQTSHQQQHSLTSHSQDWATFTSTSRALSRRGMNQHHRHEQHASQPDPSLMALEMLMSRSAGQQHQQRESRYRYNPATQVNTNAQQAPIGSEMELDVQMSHGSSSSNGRSSSSQGRWARAIASRRGLNHPDVRDGVHVTLIPGSGFPATNIIGVPGTHFPRRASHFSASSSSANNGNTTLGERTIYRLQRSRSSAAAPFE